MAFLMRDDPYLTHFQHRMLKVPNKIIANFVGEIRHRDAMEIAKFQVVNSFDRNLIKAFLIKGRLCREGKNSIETYLSMIETKSIVIAKEVRQYDRKINTYYDSIGDGDRSVRKPPQLLRTSYNLARERITNVVGEVVDWNKINSVKVESYKGKIRLPIGTIARATHRTIKIEVTDKNNKTIKTVNIQSIVGNKIKISSEDA